MGYRSNVAITAYGDKEKLVELKTYYDAEVSKLNDDSTEDLQRLISKSTGNPLWDEKTGEFFLNISDVKWYDGYPCVDLFNRVFTEARQIGLAAERVRIGEDLSDSEEEYADDNDCEYRLCIERSISF